MVYSPILSGIEGHGLLSHTDRESLLMQNSIGPQLLVLFFAAN